MTIYFDQLPVGARFEFRGRRYEKLALSLARDEDRCGNVFLDRTEVMPEAGVELRPPVPAPRCWTSHLSRAPGPRAPHPFQRNSTL